MAKYIFTKNSSLERPRNISEQAYTVDQYGTEYIYDPYDRTAAVYLLSGSQINENNKNYRQLRSLKNIINYYKANDDLFNFNNFYNNPTTLYCFYSSHLGSGLKPGSVELSVYVTGNLLAKATDSLQDGVLYQISDNQKVGIVLYKEGFILVNNTASLSSDIKVFQDLNNPPYNNGLFYDNLRWIYAFTSTDSSVYYDLSYGTKNDVYTNLNFVYAEKGEYNHSNNPTYIQSGSYYALTSSFSFRENPEIKVKNTIKSSFVSGSAIQDKQTFITNIGLYDKDKKLIGIGSLANPVRKTENREYVFKLKIDF